MVLNSLRLDIVSFDGDAGSSVRNGGISMRSVGERISVKVFRRSLLAATLSCLIPGLGQVYTGHPRRGIYLAFGCIIPGIAWWLLFRANVLNASIVAFGPVTAHMGHLRSLLYRYIALGLPILGLWLGNIFDAYFLMSKRRMEGMRYSNTESGS